MSHSSLCIVGVMFAGMLLSSAVDAATRECRSRVEVKLDPGVENPCDPSFLSALTANPQYQRYWVEGDDTTAVYDLMGPATDYQCENEIERMRRSAHAMELRVLEAGES